MIFNYDTRTPEKMILVGLIKVWKRAERTSAIPLLLTLQRDLCSNFGPQYDPPGKLAYINIRV
jgi:hypothetical protein